ncbi:hypothetical protein ACF073_37735, partial [Streptomyces sp. NPDC015171]|uniref:hypothetical protein n=1 Tax=Streptomyces sp. NPDC015171 TaxID=3364945 RepID=UPI0036FA5C2E
IFSRSDFLGAFQVLALAFPFPAVPTLSDRFRSDSLSAGFVCGLSAFASGLSTFTTLADFLGGS